mmetsp:Transcript_55022/g.159296  ORF Transcript_55022/g.159296 Transcript_55022/m.159296 type:complete len:219 (-) Transcript_55022:35-691(-)
MRRRMCSSSRARPTSGCCLAAPSPSTTVARARRLRRCAPGCRRSSYRAASTSRTTPASWRGADVALHCSRSRASRLAASPKPCGAACKTRPCGSAARTQRRAFARRTDWALRRRRSPRSWSRRLPRTAPSPRPVLALWPQGSPPRRWRGMSFARASPSTLRGALRLATWPGASRRGPKDREAPAAPTLPEVDCAGGRWRCPRPFGLARRAATQKSASR